MITSVIIDDERKGRAVLRQKLEENCPQVKVVGEAVNGEQGLQLIEKLKPDVVFLDIEMPRMNGFEMLEELKDKNFHLIFTTAYDQYAIRAIRYAAFDYLLKPVDIDELKTAIEKVSQLPKTPLKEEHLNALSENLNERFHKHKIAVPSLEGIFFYNLADIIYLKAEGNYTSIFFKDRPKLLTTRTLHDFEEILPADTFFRPHHSYIINLNFIKRYIRGDGGQIEMTNDHYVDVSRSKKEEFLKIIK